MEGIQELFTNHTYNNSLVRVFAIIAMFFIFWLVWKFVLNHMRKKWIESSLNQTIVPTENTKRLDTLLNLINAGVKLAMLGLALIMILGVFGVNLGPIIAGAGILGVAVGFGSQNLVRDVISGFFIILEDQIRIGDSAEIDGKSGNVEKINFRTVVLRDLKGAVHIIPNGSIQVITNNSKDWSGAVFDIGVAYHESVDKVIVVMNQVAEELHGDPAFSAKIVEKFEVFGLDKFDDSAVVIKARFKTKPLAQWAVKREYQRRLKIAFDREKIEIPFPYRSISLTNNSAPIKVEIQS